MVVAIIALVAALAGTGYAASKITGKDIKKESVKGNRLKPDTVTGKQVNESKLKTVPEADAVDGMEMRQFTYAADNGSSDADGARVQRVDPAGELRVRRQQWSHRRGRPPRPMRTSPTRRSARAASSAEELGNSDNRANNNAYGNISPGPFFELYSPTGTTRTTNGPFSIGFANGQIVYSVPSTGAVISIDWTWNTNVAGNDCYWSGTAVGGTEGPVTAGASARGASGSTVSEAERAAAAG